jgi:uncharacterized membrane protein
MWFRSQKSRRPVAPSPRSTGRPPTPRLRVEALESRDTPAFAFTTIDVPGASLTDVNGINRSGQVVGTYTAGGTGHGFLLSEGVYTTLDVPGATATVAWDINDAGQIAGSYTAGATTHGFLLSGGTYTTIDAPGATRTMPRGIGESGAIVGEYTADGTSHGFVLDAGTVTTIDVPGATFTSYVSEINDAGEIVGRFDNPGTNSGFLLSGGTYTTLAFPGAASSAGLGINDSGEIIGGYTAGGVRHGFLLRDGTYTPLDVPGSTFTTPRKINDSGLIAGGYGVGATTHGFLATAEPPARVASVVVNDGSAQRSMVNRLTVTFDRPVTIGAGAFELRRGDGSLVALNVATSVVSGQTAAVLTFAGSDIIGGSLADGTYSLAVHGDAVRDGIGRALDGDGDGTAGGDRVDTVFRLFGDGDGDGDVDALDRDCFRSAFNTGTGAPSYLWFFDFDGDGGVDGRDNGQFNRRLDAD